MKVLGFFKKFYNIYLLLVLALLLFVAPFTGYTFKRNFTTLNPIHFIVGLGLIVLCFFLLRTICIKKSHIWNFLHTNIGFKKILFISAPALLILEILIVSGAWFVVGWDVRNVTFPDLQVYADYMSMYPNQLFLAGLFRNIYFLITGLGLSWDNYYFCLVILSMLATFGTVILLTCSVKKMLGNFAGICFFVVGGVFFGLSPWIMVPYSDNFAMLCVSFVFWAYLYIKKPYFKWPLMIFITVIGYGIKPTVIFILMSIIFVEICIGISKTYKTKTLPTIDIKRFVTTLVSSLAALLLSFCLYYQVTSYDVSINEEESFSAAHFAMMGLSYENRGAWNQDDVNFSRSFITCQSRNDGNIKETLNRLKNLGPIGVLTIYGNKTMTNYGDATFAWEAEKPWLHQSKAQNPIICTIYGIDSTEKPNDMNNLFDKPFAAIWLMILLGAILNILQKKTSKYEAVICCSLLCISAFLMIFEPDPRYLLLYAPLILVLSVSGWSAASKYFNIFNLKPQK